MTPSKDCSSAEVQSAGYISDQTGAHSGMTYLDGSIGKSVSYMTKQNTAQIAEMIMKRLFFADSRKIIRVCVWKKALPGCRK